MASFNWQETSEDLLERYNENVLGYLDWRSLINILREHLGAEQPDPFLQAFDNFQYQIRKIDTRRRVCCIFVSHQRADVLFAERIAYLSCQHGFEYWLDVHDPLLIQLTRLRINAVVKSILIAAIVEMALLNCTHVITVQTAGAQASRWIPYEFGRAKLRRLWSTQTASWFDNGVFSSTTSDYLKLGVCAQSEQQVINWLVRERKNCNCHWSVPGNWNGNQTVQLPN